MSAAVDVYLVTQDIWSETAIPLALTGCREAPAVESEQQAEFNEYHDAEIVPFNLGNRVYKLPDGQSIEPKGHFAPDSERSCRQVGKPIVREGKTEAATIRVGVQLNVFSVFVDRASCWQSSSSCCPDLFSLVPKSELLAACMLRATTHL